MYLLFYLKTDEDVLVILSETDKDVLVILSENWRGWTCYSIWKLTRMYLLFHLKTDKDVHVILSENWRRCTCYSIWKLTRMYLLFHLKINDFKLMFLLMIDWRIYAAKKEKKILNCYCFHDKNYCWMLFR